MVSTIARTTAATQPLADRPASSNERRGVTEVAAA